MDSADHSDQLIIAKKELAFQKTEKGKRAAELVIANEELAFQNDEKSKRAAELILANIELTFQNDEKEKRAAELALANIELTFQSEEKEKRAAELILANIELTFQAKEKGKRAAELILANAELLFQNNEKEKRAAELVIANAELLFQNNEKEKRAAELVIANKELEFQNKEKEKRAQELIILNQEMEAFSYSVSHDLQSPLRKITAYATMFEKKYSGNMDISGAQILDSIVRNTKKMTRLIDDLLSFSQLGRKQVAHQEVNMSELVSAVSQDFLSDDFERRLEFTISSLPPVKCDESLIKQVWINLFGNAVKYSKYKSKSLVEVGFYRKVNHVVYYLRDNGIGFEMEYHDKLFGVFQRLHSQEEFEGTGIGRAIVQKIVQRHGGQVWAESIPGEGSSFYFSLPE